MTKPEKPLVKFFSHKSARKAIRLFIECTPEQLACVEEDVLMFLKRAHAAHDKADRTVNRIWRRVVKGATS